MREVIAVDSCPRARETVCKSTPDASARVPNEWRRSWNRTCGSFALLTNRANANENAPGSHGEPSARAKTQSPPFAFYPARFAQFLTLVLFAEDLSDKWRQRDRPGTARGLRRLGACDTFDGFERPMNREPPRVEVDVRPAQREQLTAPQAGTDRDGDDRSQLSPLRGL